MQDETLSQPLPLPRPRRSLPTVLLVAILAFALGGALVGWLVYSGRATYILPASERSGTTNARTGGTALATNPSPAPRAGGMAEASLGSVEARLALIEDRLQRITGEATAASGNAARAEGLLIAYAARRRIDKGEPLGFVEDQLKLRFGGAQPQAVQTVIAAARNPITLDELDARLDEAAPALSGVVRDESTWTRVRREVSSLFVVRRAPAPTASAQDHVARARLMLARGRIEDAMAEVQRLPGAADAQDWIEAARRYGSAQRALDVIETAAMLEPRNLKDGAGKPVEQPSPLSPPADAPPGTVG